MNNLQTNSISESDITEQNSNQEDINVYCGYLIDDTIIIKKYKSTDIIDNNNLLIGPMENFEKITYDILSYINNSNKLYEQISEFKYKLIDHYYMEKEEHEQ